jgi:phage gp29-like protein
MGVMADDNKAPEKSEIATSADGRDITKPYIWLLEQNQDAVLAAKGGGLEVYEDLLRDDQVFATFQQRRLAITSREWQVDPGAEDKQSTMAADFFKEMLFSPQIEFDDKTDKMLYGRFYGYATGEMMWGQDGRHTVIDSIKVRRARRFRYDREGGLRLLTRGDMSSGELMPDRKFWTWSVGADNDDAPYGLGLGRQCYWPVFFKRNGIKFWLIFLDKYGMPTAKGSYPPNASAEDQKKLLQAAGALGTDRAVIVPDGMLLELLQSQRSGTADYAALVDKMNDAISKVILSQTRTTDAVAGELGGAGEHMEVRDEVAKADSDLLCASFNRGPARWLTDWNYPNAVPPRVYRNFEEEDDLDKSAERDTKVYAMGFEPSEVYINDKYGGEWTKRAPAPSPLDLLRTTPGIADNPNASTLLHAAAFAEDANAIAAQRSLDKAVTDQLAQWREVMSEPKDQLQEAFDGAGSFAELKTALAKLRGKLTMKKLGDALFRTTTGAMAGALEGRGLEENK